MEVRRALAASEMMRRREMENDNQLPGPGFPGSNRPMRRVNGEGAAVVGSTDDSGAALMPPGSDETPEAGTGEEANGLAHETPPGVPDETAIPPSPEAPDPLDFNGLEPPPMPPGF
jgi:hypothetical protein